MISATPEKIKFRENRSWGYELRKGPEGLEAMVTKKSGAKPYACNMSVGKIGNVFIPIQIHKKITEVKCVSASAWVSFPASVELSSAFGETVLRAQKAVWRLAKRQMSNYFRGKFNAKGKTARAGTPEGEKGKTT